MYYISLFVNVGIGLFYLYLVYLLDIFIVCLVFLLDKCMVFMYIRWIIYEWMELFINYVLDENIYNKYSIDKVLDKDEFIR